VDLDGDRGREACARGEEVGVLGRGHRVR
jgi:hypothetical protein